MARVNSHYEPAVSLLRKNGDTSFEEGEKWVVNCAHAYIGKIISLIGTGVAPTLTSSSVQAATLHEKNLFMHLPFPFPVGDAENTMSCQTGECGAHINTIVHYY